jgi:tetratricopeptide (TPR) repeat protein
MTASRRVVPALVFIELIFFARVALPQGGIGSQRQFVMVEIRGQVRYSSGQPAEQGIQVTIEDMAGGGIVASLQTDQQGKFDISGIRPAVYNVRVEEQGYREVSQRVELTTVPTAYVILTLMPLPGQPRPAAGPGGASTQVSAAELALPEETRKEFEEARTLVEQQNEPKKGIPHLQKVIQADPSFVEAHLLLGTAQMDLRHWKDAESTLQETVTLDNKSSQAYLALGTCFNEQQNYSEAEKPLLRGLELDPESSLGHYELARAYWGLNRWQDAAPHAQKAVQINPNFAPAHVVLGNVMLRERNAPGALKEFKEYLRLDPKGPLSAPVKDIVGKIEKALAGSH